MFSYIISCILCANNVLVSCCQSRCFTALSIVHSGIAVGQTLVVRGAIFFSFEPNVLMKFIEK